MIVTSHGSRSIRVLAIGLAMAVLVTMMGSPLPPSTADNDDTLVSVIVRGAPGVADGAAALVETVGGVVGRALGLIGGFEATVPVSAIPLIEASSLVETVTENATLTLSAAGWEDSSTLNGMDPKTHPGSLYEVTRYIGARQLWNNGYTGAGIDIALIDSGVAPVNGLTVSGKIVNGPDLSFESQYDSLRYLDTFGHGTHIAGIIAGRDDQVTGNVANASSDYFVGVAPDARIVSIKVADAHGVTDVSQVIAAIDWVVQNRQSGDLDIRVMSLSFGTDSTQSYLLDPLAYAVEQAWNAGIVVVVAAGNDGNGQPLRNPALDPFVIAVGASDPNGTNGASDDTVPEFSNCGTADRSVDIVAHGRSITSLRAPGSYIDAENPGAVVVERLFIGSGTSQATAVVAGAVALLLDENPGLDPDQIKSVLVSTAVPVIGASALCQGGGAIDVKLAAHAKAPRASKVFQDHTPSTGDGSIEASRGTDHLTADGVTLEGEQDIMGNPWNGFNEVVTTCRKEGKGKNAITVCEDRLVATDTLWGDGGDGDGGDWNGATWSGSSWSGSSWSGSSWSGATWSGSSWSGSSWSGSSWSGGTWSGATWSGSSWSGGTWSGSSWSGATWSGATWSGATWSVFTWD